LKLPPLLDHGAHEVRVRTTESGFSNAVQIHVGPAEQPATPFQPESESEPAPRIYAVESNVTGTPTFRGYKNEYLSVFFEARETDLDRSRVQLQLNEAEIPILFIGNVGDGRWQMNSRLPLELPPGTHRLKVRTARSSFSESLEIRLDPE